MVPPLLGEDPVVVSAVPEQEHPFKGRYAYASP